MDVGNQKHIYFGWKTSWTRPCEMSDIHTRVILKLALGGWFSTVSSWM